jgi:predicted nucleic-acid-binding protein
LGWQKVKFTVDTNVLVRAVVGDDVVQAGSAAKLLASAELIAVTLPCLCEFVWVLLRVYKFKSKDAAAAIRALIAVDAVQVNRPAVDAGLAMLEAGGDFADGVIAFEGHWLGGERFVSFDKKAVALLVSQGRNAELLR